jgi:translocation and assembly module TamA
VTDALSLVGFYDFGIVDTSPFIGSGAANHSGAGMGVRYDLGGFGPLRFDLALPVQGNTGNGLQFYLGIGQAF